MNSQRHKICVLRSLSVLAHRWARFVLPLVHLGLRSCLIYLYRSRSKKVYSKISNTLTRTPGAPFHYRPHCNTTKSLTRQKLPKLSKSFKLIYCSHRIKYVKVAQTRCVYSVLCTLSRFYGLFLYWLRPTVLFLFFFYFWPNARYTKTWCMRATQKIIESVL